MKVKLFLPIGVLYLSIFFSCSHHLTKSGMEKDNEAEPVSIILGNENLLMNYPDLLKGKRVGLVTNPSGVNSKLIPTADILFNNKDINLTALFGPEHGIRGAVHAGDHVADDVDPQTGIPVYSLYGKNRKPTAEMMQNVDVMIFDIQDIGSRSYTYIYTMAMVMEAAAENSKEVVILDRPNPVGGIRVEGNLVEKGFESFVGLYPIPYRHGMTIGELALLFNTEYDIKCKLTVIPMLNWKRDMLWEDTDLEWVPTSPHIPHKNSPLFYCATGTIGELHTVSNGVGYTSPFELIGAPWIEGENLAKALNDLELPGVFFRPLYFRPYYFQFTGETCQGVQVHLIEPKNCELFTMGLHIIETLNELYPEQKILENEERVDMFNKVMGCDWIRNDLIKNVPVDQIEKKWRPELNKFLKTREKYLIY